MSASTEKPEHRRLGIQSVEIAATILKALAHGGGSLPLNKLSRLAGMHSGKVHRYLISLTRSGLVTQDPESGHYRIGPLAITIGLTGLRISHPLRLAFDALPSLRDEVGETTAAAIWAEHGPTVVAIEESHHAVTMNVRIASRMPLIYTAIGRVFAAFLPSNLTEPFLQSEFEQGRRSAAVGQHQVRTRAELDAILEQVREEGIAGVEGTLLPGLNALAAPVFDHRGQVSLVIGIVGRQETLDMHPEGEAIKALKAATEDVSTMLGFVRGAGDCRNE